MGLASSGTKPYQPAARASRLLPALRARTGLFSHSCTSRVNVFFPRGGSVMRVSKMILVVAVAALLAMPAAAQPPFGRGGGRGGAGMLLGNPGVQKELKLSEEQTKKVQELVTKNGEKMREAFQGGDQEKTQEVMKEIAAETDKFIKATLNADQQKRLKQIQRQ